MTKLDHAKIVRDKMGFSHENKIEKEKAHPEPEVE